MNLSARNSPVPGLFTQIFSVVNLSPFLISFIETIDAYAKSIVGFSSRMGPFLPLEASLTILDALKQRDRINQKRHIKAFKSKTFEKDW